MTYSELKDLLNEFNEEQLAQDVTVYHSEFEEYNSLSGLCPVATAVEEDCDVLDPGHKYLVV